MTVTKDQILNYVKIGGVYGVLRLVEYLVRQVHFHCEVDIDLEENDIGVDTGSEDAV